MICVIDQFERKRPFYFTRFKNHPIFFKDTIFINETEETERTRFINEAEIPRNVRYPKDSKSFSNIDSTPKNTCRNKTSLTKLSEKSDKDAICVKKLLSNCPVTLLDIIFGYAASYPFLNDLLKVSKLYQKNN